MLETPPYVLQNASHSAEMARRGLVASTDQNSAGVGVLSPTDMTVTPGSGMSVSIAPGEAFVPGTLGTALGGRTWYGDTKVTTNGGVILSKNAVGARNAYGRTTQGNYYTFNGSALSIAVAASDPTNPRIDVVGIQVQDSVYSGASNQAIGTIVTGVAAASPVIPTVPANFLILAYVWVPGGTSSIASGNIVSVANSALANPYTCVVQITALQTTTAGNPFTGSAIFDPLSMYTSPTVNLPTAGVWNLTGNVLYQAFTGTPSMAITIGGSTILQTYITSASTTYSGLAMATNWYANAPTTFTYNAENSASGTIYSGGRSYMSAVLVG